MTVVPPECPGWETMIGYIFQLAPADNTNLYYERNTTLHRQYAFQNVPDGNYSVKVIGQNVCEEYTVLDEDTVLIGRLSLSQ